MDIYDRDGNPISMVRFNELLGDLEYRRVASTNLPSGLWVSTVWLGVDHSFSFLNETRPVIFETMVFGDPDDRLDYDIRRYCTELEAIEGHIEVVRSLVVPDSLDGQDIEASLNDWPPPP